MHHSHPSSDFTPSDTSRLAEGMKVEHAKFGSGGERRSTPAHDRKARIFFDKAARRRCC
jgi:DNA helicase-2/ATP-dependent DNA helicase PcrA